ncbi:MULTISPECIES: helix-turn-helix domain-containing protein [Citrobacter]|uniref:helix-turn-helix domain-containing protein n=1 Tax=Citrobacter TaxID=544 RepID=UPI0015EAF0F0|nr:MULTISPECIES: DNA-binding protein [Citrobacter]EHG7582531.1 DNA-binding protein [Citrobacter sedlakii]EIQ7158823.1 DNA-binding protein [Citrobacter sedlakii]EKX8505674.1 DNA-binding protein [Citrobacter sedlakii]MBN6599649.1 DNA-binding protein [Citrobacter sedlakii]QMK44853.1 DNA-binding protein [Citrobacter sp. RHB21-C05]
MARRIDYLIEKYQFTEINESPRIASQWKDVLAECQQEQAGVEERLRIALLNVDYVTSFELPFRLLLTRTPQLIDKLRKEFSLTQKSVLINEKRRGQVYSISADLSRVPDAFRYRLSSRIRRMDDQTLTTAPYQQVASETKQPEDRLRLALESGLAVNALDGLFWLGIQRIAADIQRLRASGMPIQTTDVEVSDTLTGTVRTITAYHL